MRRALPPARIALLIVILFTSVAMAQGAQQGGNVLFNKLNNGPGGPAPRHDLSGSWTGPVQAQMGEVPPMTPLGKQLFSANKPERQFNVKGTNDNFVRTCDPMGFPYNAVYEIRGIAFGTMPDRILVLSQMQRVWREVWMDGRELPKNVGGAEKGSPDPRYYGYSVGHWEGDNTLVIDTTGLDEKTWLDLRGYPHSVDAHVQERYTRPDHNDLQLTIMVDDPKMYTKPFSLGTASFKWIPNQELDEQLCVPSDIIEYMKLIGNLSN